MFHTPVAADVSRRNIQCGKNAPTDVGGYMLSAIHTEREISGLKPANGAIGKPENRLLNAVYPPQIWLVLTAG